MTNRRLREFRQRAMDYIAGNGLRPKGYYNLSTVNIIVFYDGMMFQARYRRGTGPGVPLETEALPLVYVTLWMPTNPAPLRSWTEFRVPSPRFEPGNFEQGFEFDPWDAPFPTRTSYVRLHQGNLMNAQQAKELTKANVNTAIEKEMAKIKSEIEKAAREGRYSVNVYDLTAPTQLHLTQQGYKVRYNNNYDQRDPDPRERDYYTIDWS